MWVSFQPLIVKNRDSGAGDEVSIVAKFLFGIFLCAAVLLFEKFSIQWIAGSFHELSYAGSFIKSKPLDRDRATYDFPRENCGPKDGCEGSRHPLLSFVRFRA